MTSITSFGWTLIILMFNPALSSLTCQSTCYGFNHKENVTFPCTLLEVDESTDTFISDCGPLRPSPVTCDQEHVDNETQLNFSWHPPGDSSSKDILGFRIQIFILTGGHLYPRKSYRMNLTRRIQYLNNPDSTFTLRCLFDEDVGIQNLPVNIFVTSLPKSYRTSCSRNASSCQKKELSQPCDGQVPCNDIHSECTTGDSGGNVCRCKAGYYDSNGYSSVGGICTAMSTLAVTGLKVVKAGTNTVNITWTPPSDYICCVNRYEVHWTPSSTINEKTLYNARQTTYVQLKGFSPGQKYTFSVVTVESGSRSGEQNFSITAPPITMRGASISPSVTKKNFGVIIGVPAGFVIVLVLIMVTWRYFLRGKRKACSVTSTIPTDGHVTASTISRESGSTKLVPTDIRKTPDDNTQNLDGNSTKKSKTKHEKDMTEFMCLKPISREIKRETFGHMTSNEAGLDIGCPAHGFPVESYNNTQSALSEQSPQVYIQPLSISSRQRIANHLADFNEMSLS